ncbi:MAG: 2Fe-2S iron-sulfur cluster-binding protein [Phreatobacter sp.]|uniref:2Fe-2S iron-sulfur cluster-binding protein n=1 Tax=Phreatobacter sp. TaxID=1966341 RepID=UPI0027322EC2|nr:2Fe-2S iron-sulfur cluster-binding protein [Phreatobacter sp.]MDP2801447.1 2Fe-2S iron-sulfur cluster-binding protein [Phreatobacter sp.]
MSLVRVSNGVTRPAAATFAVDGMEVSAPAGEPLATALAAAGLLGLRDSPRGGTPRGAFCHMGLCQECVVTVDGRIVQACLTPVRAGMQVGLGGTLR